MAADSRHPSRRGRSPTLYQPMAAPDGFAAYLASRHPLEHAGVCSNALECPISEYMLHILGATSAVEVYPCPPASGLPGIIWVNGRRYALSAWANAFALAVDQGPRGPLRVAAARRILASVLQQQKESA